MAGPGADDPPAGRPRSSTRSDSNCSVSSSDSKPANGTTMTTTRLAAVLDHEGHPLSPDLAVTAGRTSYFRPSPSLITSVVEGPNALFKEEDDDETDENGERQKISANTPRLSPFPERLAKPPENMIIRLTRPPHLLSHEDLKRQLDGEREDGLAVSLVQVLSEKVERLQEDLQQLKSRHEVREKVLLQLLKESSAGQVTDGRISRALLRANAETIQAGVDTSPQRRAAPWRISVPTDRDVPELTATPKSEAPLAENLRDAMSDLDFPETALKLSPASMSSRGGSPNPARTADSLIVASSQPTSNRRQGVHPALSISANFSASTSSPSSKHNAIAYPNALVSTSILPNSERLPFVPITRRKARANSLQSVSSNASSKHHAKGKSSWISSLWGWKQSSDGLHIRNKHLSDEDGEDEMLADEAGSRQSFTYHPAARDYHGVVSRKDKEIPEGRGKEGRSRAMSQSSDNSTSGTTIESGTAATSFTSHSGQILSLTVGADVTCLSDPHPQPIGSTDQSISIRTNTTTDTERVSAISQTTESPVKMLLGRRVSSVHAEPAVTKHVVSKPAPPDTSRLSSSSSAMLQSISSLNDHIHSLAHPVPSHYRALSESASTLGKNAGKLLAQETFVSHTAVSENVSQWTHRLLASLNPPGIGPAPVLLTMDSLSELNIQDYQDYNVHPGIRRSPRLTHTQKSKAALSPASMDNDASTTTIKLSASSPTSLSPSDSTTDGVLLAPRTMVKPKGYLSSAKGTLGRAFGLGNSSSTSSLSTKSMPTSRAFSQPQYPIYQSVNMHRNSSKSANEPTLTLPISFTSFTTSAGLLPSNLNIANHRPLQSLYTGSSSTSNAVQMGTIIAPAAKPPTLSVDMREQKSNGPLVDRYGFVYDLKAGMKLLKDSRRLQQQEEQGIGLSLGSPPDDSQVNVDELREALGPSPNPTPGIETALAGAALVLSVPVQTIVDDITNDPEKPDVQSSESSSSDPHTATIPDKPSNQSVRRLLTQLGEMNETLEKSQKEAWDAFIRRRKSKAAKALKDDEVIATRRKRMTIIEVPLSMGGDPDDNEGVEQFFGNLVGVASMGSGKEDDKAFQKLVRAGVPISYRPSIWSEVSGASEMKEPGLYQELLSAHANETSPCLEQIDMDTHRTFPTNIFFAGNGPGVSKLRRVLIAYSWRDPTIGYCQGMNLLAAMLLLVYPDEEDAFWMMSSVLERILPSDYFSPQLLVSQADQRVLQDLIQIALPELYDHLDDLGVDLPAITFGWFLSLFTDAFPIQTLLRVWDVLLVYGPITLFRIAIAIFKIHSSEIFATDSASNFYVLITSLTSHLYSADKLLKIAFDDFKFIKRQDIETRRLKHVADIARELAPSGPSAVDSEAAGP